MVWLVDFMVWLVVPSGSVHVQVSTAGSAGGWHSDEGHDCQQYGDDGGRDERAGETGDDSGRAGEAAGGCGDRGQHRDAQGCADFVAGQEDTPFGEQVGDAPAEQQADAGWKESPKFPGNP